jgi:hypothetical protein
MASRQANVSIVFGSLRPWKAMIFLGSAATEQKKNRFSTWAPCNLYFDFFFEISILKFQKILQKYVDVANYIHYDRTNSCREKPYIVGSAKKQTEQNLEHVPRYDIFLFLLRTEYKAFHNKNSHTGGTNRRLHSGFFLDFFEIQFFLKFKKSSTKLVLQIDTLQYRALIQFISNGRVNIYHCHSLRQSNPARCNKTTAAAQHFFLNSACQVNNNETLDK